MYMEVLMVTHMGLVCALSSRSKGQVVPLFLTRVAQKWCRFKSFFMLLHEIRELTPQK